MSDASTLPAHAANAAPGETPVRANSFDPRSLAQWIGLMILAVLPLLLLFVLCQHTILSSIAGNGVKE